MSYRIAAVKTPPKRGRQPAPSEFTEFLLLSASLAAKGKADESWGAVTVKDMAESQIVLRELNRAGRINNLKVATSREDLEGGKVKVYFAATERPAESDGQA